MEKMTGYLLCLVSSPLEAPRVLLGTVCNHTSSGEACKSEFLFNEKIEATGKQRRGGGEAILCARVLFNDKIERI